jgi:hypothetical protein
MLRGKKERSFAAGARVGSLGMPYLTVIILAAAAGGAVAAFTLWEGRPRPAAGRRRGSSASQAQVLPSAPTAQTRLTAPSGSSSRVLAGAG